MKIAMFEIEEWERQAFSELEEEHDVVYRDGPLDAEAAEEVADADILSVFIYSRIDCDLLDRFHRLKLIATRSTGIDHIDLAGCQDRDIAVATVPTYGGHAVAEHTFALLLAISHEIVEAVDRTRRGDFSQKGLRGFNLHGRTMGVVGTGDIGANVARIARGFGMEVLAFDVEPQEELAEEVGFTYHDLPDLLSRADVVSLHVPATEATENMISHDEFAAMKEGVVLINTARGSVVDTEAMLKALSDGRLAAAGLDVLDEEPTVREEGELLRSFFQEKHKLDDLLADHLLLRMRNVIVTPHSAFNTRDALDEILDTTRENMESFMEGEPRNLVHP
ncbi:MAG: hydroxyacid dehydrogenase [Gemmatimonadales bacterium]|nr:MAG: hydroxyacid dehydrogenase [Gemmatimonadales bacterium]